MLLMALKQDIKCDVCSATCLELNCVLCCACVAYAHSQRAFCVAARLGFLELFMIMDALLTSMSNGFDQVFVFSCSRMT